LRYIRALQQGDPQAAGISPGIRARSQLSSAAAVHELRSFGPLQSLRFAGVAADGMDLYEARFAGRVVQWWIAPLAGGRIVWVGFANPARQS
jgi:hypothetical protein